MIARAWWNSCCWGTRCGHQLSTQSWSLHKCISCRLWSLRAKVLYQYLNGYHHSALGRLMRELKLTLTVAYEEQWPSPKLNRYLINWTRSLESMASYFRKSWMIKAFGATLRQLWLGIHRSLLLMTSWGMLMWFFMKKYFSWGLHYICISMNVTWDQYHKCQMTKIWLISIPAWSLVLSQPSTGDRGFDPLTPAQNVGCPMVPFLFIFGRFLAWVNWINTFWNGDRFVINSTVKMETCLLEGALPKAKWDFRTPSTGQRW